MGMRKALVAFGLVMGTAAAANAGSAQSNLSVSANVTSTCTINAGSLSFGSYDPVAGTQVDGSATVSVACTKGASAQITLGQGTHAAGGSTDAVPNRRMADGSNNLQYSLFSDASRSVTWANTAGTSVGYASTTSAASSLTVYGRIAAGQDVPAGSYTDTVVATVSF